MYASPVTSTMSHESQPSASISARVVGSTSDWPKRFAQYGRCEKSWGALCTGGVLRCPADYRKAQGSFRLRRMLDPDFVADSPYGPGGLLIDDITEVDRA